MTMSPDGRWIAAGQTDGVQLWRRDEQGAWHAWELEPGIDHVLQVAVDPQSRLLAAGNFFGEIALWDLESGRLQARPDKRQDRGVYALTFTQDSALLASGSLDGRLVVWDVAQLTSGDAMDVDTMIAEACQIANRNLSAGICCHP